MPTKQEFHGCLIAIAACAAWSMFWIVFFLYFSRV